MGMEGRRENVRELGRWGLGEPPTGDEFVLKAQIQKGAESLGLSRMGFSERRY